MAVRRNVRENFAQTRDVIGTTISQPVYDLLRAYSDAFMRTYADLFRARADGGYIRDCHGDLHAAQVFLEKDSAIPDGVRISVIDCIEFNKRFRYSDVASDLAFLAMGLDYLGRADLSRALVQHYVELSGDGDLLKLPDFYKVYRPYVRGKVEGFRLADANLLSAERKELQERAARHFTLAAEYARPEGPLLLITTGLMATGKIVLAREFGERLGAEVLASDVVRNVARGLAVTERRPEAWGAGFYSEEAVEQNHQELLSAAREKLMKGQRVIADASFRKAAWRAGAHAVANEAGAPFLVLECRAQDAVARQRLDARAAIGKDASDARWEPYARQKAAFEPVRGFARGQHLVLDTNLPSPEVTQRALEGVFKALFRQRGHRLGRTDAETTGDEKVPVALGSP
ncbi:MAG: hypothetical protein EXR48_01290 [Dehalococcoidia bacterium]|nr:hypothetical protein [Dehalococcoidia bacterium]